MTSTDFSTRTTTDLPSRTPLLAALGFGASAVLTAIGTFWAVNDSSDASRDEISTWLVCVAIAGVTALIAFGLVVRTAPGGNAGRRSAITGVVAFLSLAVFWAGIPTVLAAAAVACALTDRDTRGSFGTAAKIGLGLSAVTTVAAVLAAIFG